MKGLVFTYVLTYGGALASLFRPYVGLLIYVAFAILRPEALWAFSVPLGGRYSLILALALLGGWVVSRLGNWRFGSGRGVVVALIAYWGWLCISAMAAPNQELAWGRVGAMSKCFLPCVVAMTLIETRKELLQLVWVLVLCQGYLALEFNQQYYAGEINPDEWLFATLDNNVIAITMATSVGLAFFLGLQATLWWQKALAFGSAALMAHVILFSMSRGGMLALGVAGFVSFLILPKRPVHYAVFLVAALLVLRLAGRQVETEFSTIFAEEVDRDNSAQSRVDLTIAMIGVMAQNPIVGLGPAHFHVNAHLYGFTPGKEGHNNWAQAGAETGIPGVAFLLCFFLLAMGRLTWLAARNRSDAPQHAQLTMLARGVVASLTGFLISAAFVSCEGIELPYYVGIVGAGILKLQSTSDGQVAGGLAETALLPRLAV